MRIPKQGFAEFFGVSQRTVSDWEKEGMPTLRQSMGTGLAKRGRRVMIQSEDACKWLLERYKVKKKFRTEAERFKNEQTVKVALHNAERRGELVTVEYASHYLMEAFQDLVSQLESIPGRMANELAGITDPARVRELLLGETRRVRINFGGRLDQFGKLEKGNRSTKEDSSAPTEPVSGDVGGSKPDSTARKRRTRRLEKQQDAMDNSNHGESQ